jgi:hypothetical protein
MLGQRMAVKSSLKPTTSTVERALTSVNFLVQSGYSALMVLAVTQTLHASRNLETVIRVHIAKQTFYGMLTIVAAAASIVSSTQR